MKKIFLTILLAIALTPCVSKADDYKLIAPLPCIQGVSSSTTCVNGLQTHIDISTYILYVYKFGIALAVFLAIIMIIWGGFEYITSEVPFIKSDGKGKIENAVFGLVMVLISYLVLATIDPRLVNIDAKIEPIKVNIDDSQAFRDRINADITKTNIENQTKLKALDDITAQLQEERRNIDDEVASGQLTPGEAEKLYAQIDQDLKQVGGEKVIVKSNNEGQSNFKRALIAIQGNDEENLKKYTREPIPDYQNGTTEGRYPVNEPEENEIQSEYNQRIRELLKANPNAFDEVENLNLQKSFYMNQVLVEEDLDYQISKYKQGTGITFGAGPAYNSNKDNTKLLNQKLETYKSEMNDPTKLEASGIPESDYKKLYQERIDKINSTLVLNIP